MRGKVFGQLLKAVPAGITPAYAGKSSGPTSKSGTNGDHSRVCGEKTPGFQKLSDFMGSPPRMRGKVALGVHPVAPLGITPAYAGKSITTSTQKIKKRDHPRVCGEKKRVARQNGHQNGSPPRMRGKASRWRESADSCRITPAYAGKRQIWKERRCCHEDHPRVCGEKTKKIP